MKLVVIGAGPVGLAAALGALRRGHDITVFEAAASVGASLLRWGPTRFFSPLGMNLPPGAAEWLPDVATLGERAILTGPEFVARVLEPLAASAPLRGRIEVATRVVAVGRDRLTRADHAGHPLRGERGFRVLVDGAAGERVVAADQVIDASGVTLPAPLGLGGAALGERALAPRLIRDLGALHQRRSEWAGRRVLLVGHGHSAANALAVLGEGSARVTWAVRTPNLRPCIEVASDPLPERQAVVAAANVLAQRPPDWLTVERRAVIEALAPRADAIAITLSGGRSAEVDAVVGLTGFRPDLTPFGDLQLELSPATEGGAGLARALASVTDCLAVPTVPPAALASGETGFHLAGARSYGRSPSFLLRTGYAQLQTILDSLGA